MSRLVLAENLFDCHTPQTFALQLNEVGFLSCGFLTENMNIFMMAVMHW
jgi:hypothetical protein